MKIFDKDHIQAIFVAVATTYDQAAVLQREVAERLLLRLQTMPKQPEFILDLGGGTGYLARLLKQYCRQAYLSNVDIALPMLQLAQKQMQLPEVSYCCGDAEQLAYADDSFDLVISNLLLHWCPNYQLVLQEVQRVLKPNGLFLFSTLGPDSFSEFCSCLSQVNREKQCHQFLDMHHIGDALQTQGFLEPVVDRQNITLTYSDVMDIIQDLKSCGIYHLLIGDDNHSNLESEIATITDAYRHYQLSNQLFPVNYEVIYGHARMKEKNLLKSMNVSGEVSFSVEELLKQLT